MANFKGHALPGSIFIFLSLWWSLKSSLKYFSKTLNKSSHSPASFKHLEILEGAVFLGFAIIGILCEQFVPDGPHFHLYDVRSHHWVKLMNWQHSTMYFFFGLYGMVVILSKSSNKVPSGLDQLMLAVALFFEGFLFYFHVSHRPMLDQHIHSLLLFAIFPGGATSLIKIFMQDNIILDFLTCSLILLQGTWFYQIGFVLYPPWGGPEWDQNDHDNIMFTTMCFCWHYATAVLIWAGIHCLAHCIFQNCQRNNRQIGIRLGLWKQNNSHAALLNASDDE